MNGSRTPTLTITFRPTPAVNSLLSKAVNQCARRKGPGRKSAEKKGLRSSVINEALLIALAKYAGKRESEIILPNL
jgi:hypothetical protein